MFTLLAALLCYALLTFGAVLPNSWLSISIIWLISFIGLVVHIMMRDQKAPASLLLVIALAIFILGFVQPKLAIGFAAGLWAWAAASRNDQRQTLRFFHLLI